jgi:hypothetical protein
MNLFGRCPSVLRAIAASFSSAAGLDIETVNSRPPYLKL